MNNYDNYTNLFSLSKTLRFELQPIGKTKETFRQWFEELRNAELVVDGDSNLFIKDKKIKDAYLAIKPVMDYLHEQFIDEALKSNEAKKIDFSKYFDAYRNKMVKEEMESELRKAIAETFQSAGKIFVEKISQSLKGGKGINAKKDKLYECLTDAKMLNYLSVNATELAKQIGLDEQILTKHIKLFQGFWGYLDGYNLNRENYYTTDKEQSTAVATRIVHENLPTFCSNALRFEKRREEYLGIFQYLKDNNRETKIKNSKGEESEAESITETIFQINHFTECLAQSQIEEYNRIIGNYNMLINLYNQLRCGEKEFKKIDEFEILYKQIGCGKKKTMYETLQNPSDVKSLLQKAKNAGDAMFNKGCNETEIKTIPDFIHFLKGCDNWDGIYMSSAAINKISNHYFANWHSIKDKLLEWYNSSDKKLKEKANACITYDKKQEEPIKMRDAVELSGIFAMLDTEQSEHLYKESLFKDDGTNEYHGVLDNALSSSKNLVNLLCFDLERNAKAFLKESDKIVALENYKDKNNHPDEEDQTIKQIKDWFDAATDTMRIVRYFSVRKSKMKGNVPNVTMEQALSNLLYNNDTPWFKWYDLIRNYLTKKPQDDAKENKLKLNFGSSSLLKGWEPDYYSKAGILFERDDVYYLAIIKNKLTDKEKQKLTIDADSNLIKRIIIDFQKPDSKNTPRLFIRSKGDNYAPAVEKYKLPVQDIIEIYDKKLYKTEHAKTNPIEYKKSLHKLIDYFKKGFSLHESFKHYNYVWKDSEDYNNINDFYRDVQTSCYQVKFEKTNWDTLLDYVNSEKLYLFKIHNKDFEPGGTGKPNMHTLYWKMLFDEINLKDISFKLDGQGAEIFMREPVAKVSPIKHTIGSKLVNKRDKDGNTIPEQLYREIYMYVNGKAKNISEEAKKYIDEQIAVIKDVKHEIVKDKRFYGDEAKYMFHCPITINFKAKADRFSDINSKITNALQQSDNLQFIGIDRGEKHLIYSCTIDKTGKIVKCHHHDNINGTNYVQKLEAVADERVIAKKNWQTQNKIKDLKSGYISHVVHRLVEETIKDDDKIAPHAYIVLEDLSAEMKRGRQKFEKQVYQNLETALAKKLNFVVDKNAKQGELGSTSKALQLTPPINNYQDIEGKKQFGVMLYTRANYTSVTDPTTGWRKTIYIKNGTEEDIKHQILDKINDFGFDGKDYYFEYTEANAGHTWRLYSGKNGNPLPRFQNKKQIQQDKNIL